MIGDTKSRFSRIAKLGEILDEQFSRQLQHHIIRPGNQGFFTIPAHITQKT